MSTHKKIWLLFSLGLTSLFVACALLFLPLKKPRESLSTPALYPTPVVTAAMITPTVSGHKPLMIVSAIPASTSAQAYLPITQVEFTFDQDVSAQNFYYSISPAVETEVFEKPHGKAFDTTQTIPTTLILSPKTAWLEGLTTITIYPQTTAQNGAQLEKPFVYKLNTKFPEVDPGVN